MLETIPGVTIAVRIAGGESLTVEEDGYIGKLEPRDTVRVVVEVHDTNHLHGFTVNGTRDIQPKRLFFQDENRKKYRFDVHLERSGQGFPATAYFQNHMRFLDIRAGGEFSIWEIAIVAQYVGCFLSVQEHYQARCYRDESCELYCPAFLNWPQLVSFLRPHFADQMDELFTVSEFPPEEEISRPTAKGLLQGQGRVIWWNRALGAGAITTLSGDARVHWSEVTRHNERARYLKADEVVTYQKLVTPPKNELHPTQFQWQAVGVVRLHPLLDPQLIHH